MNESALPASRQVVVGAGGQTPLKFAFWGVRAEIVVDNVARYAAETGECVACIEVPGDYERALGQQFAAGEGPDVFYAQRAEASLWDAQGYLAPIDEADPRVAPLLRRMDRRLVDGARNRDGRLIGLTYYNGGPFALFVHEAFTGHVELDSLKDWKAVLNQLRLAKRDGLSPHPFVPRWHRSQTGLVWSLLCHLASEGVLDLDAPDAPAAMRDALAFFASLVDEDLVPAASLADEGDTAALERWASGGHMLTFTTDYLAMDACESAGRPINIVAPRLPGRTGTPLMPGHALLCIRSGIDDALLTRARGLLTYLGGTAPDGSLRVHSRWSSECLFAVPYAELDARADIRAGMARAFPEGLAEACVERLATARRSAEVSPLTHAPWFLEWSAMCDATIRYELLRDRTMSAASAADALLEKWSILAARNR